MDKIVDRRGFLQVAAGGAMGLAAVADARLGAAESPDVSRDTSKDTRLFVGCCAYSFRLYLGKHRMTMEDFIRKGVELGVDGVDMTAYWLTSREPAYLASLRHVAFKNGMPFSGAACGSSMVQADQAKRVQTLDDIKQWIDATDLLGATHLRVFAGELPRGATVAQGLDWSVETMRPACDYAAKKGITLGVENHAGITQRADTCLELLRRVDSPYAGINLDISNFIASSDEDQYRQIEACVPYATHTHIRDHFGDSQRPIELDRVWQLFAKGGYKGYMSVEYEGHEDAMTGVPKLLAKVKPLCRKYSSV